MLQKKNAFKHGFAWRDQKGHRSSLYLAWVNMRQRCRNIHKPDYKYYGGKGINYSEEWEEFDNFLKDMGYSYNIFKEKYGVATLDRIDVNKGYSPENCRWATRKEQSNNRNYNLSVNHQNQTLTLDQWIRKLPISINRNQLYDRIFKRKWNVKRAFTQPLKKYRI